MKTRTKEKRDPYTKNLPMEFYTRVTRGLTSIPQKDYVPALLRNIHKEFDRGSGYVTTTSNIYLSRCLPIDKIIKMRLRTCGSFAAVAVACLTKMGIDARLIDGKVYDKGRWRSHAWIEVLDKDSEQWIPYDAFSENFKLRSKHKRLRMCRDWSEMESELYDRAQIPNAIKNPAGLQIFDLKYIQKIRFMLS